VHVIKNASQWRDADMIVAERAQKKSRLAQAACRGGALS